MAKKHHHGARGPHHSDEDSYEHEHEPYDDPGEHREIERRRFVGSLEPTPERYAHAREQWYRLPGSLVRPPMDPAIRASAEDEAPQSDQANLSRGRTES
jgi:hypothetical protein